MKNYQQYVINFAVLCCLAMVSGTATARPYDALQGLHSAQTVIDFRTSDLQMAEIYLTLIHDTYNDQSIKAVTSKPEFVIVFGGTSPRLLSTTHKGLTGKEAMTLKRITAKLSAMAKDGIQLKLCKYGARLLKVAADSDVTGMQYVDNGWISLIGYQAKGYALMAAY